ncbi:MAG: murein L,D-transpeptidase family protein [Hyphomicrobiales bacterium]|nr:murein L,D-transpeptidase family protein [Hyphomicrobiales bacterium]
MGGEDIAPHTKQLPAEAQALLAKKGMTEQAAIFVRIFKEENELEIWKQMADGRYAHFKTYPICKWSGELGPKIKQGDKQAPEGFYTVRPGQMNPNSQLHLAFNLGYPNDFDRAHGRDGSALMVHGKCKSAGCFAMTDALIEEIYILAREAFKGGQTAFHVNAFPFRMTEENMKRYASSEWIDFWRQLKVGYDSFEFFRVPPKVAVCSKQYLVNVSFMGHEARPDPKAPCPSYQHITPDVTPGFENLPTEQIARAPAERSRVASIQTPRSISPAPVESPAPETAVSTAPVVVAAPAPAAPSADGYAAAAYAPAPVEPAAPAAEPTLDALAAPAAPRRSGKGDRLDASAAPPAQYGYAPR